MSSGSKANRGTKGARGGTDRSKVVTSSISSQSKSDHNHNDKERDISLQKLTPTAEQLRIAQMIDNTHPDKGLQEKINQVMQVTGVSTDDAIVALYDCDNDINSAIDSLLEGEDQGEWKESTKKKKKPPVTKVKEETDSNKENRRVENRERSGGRSRGGSGPPRFRGRGGRSNKDDSNDGIGRGSRRGRMTNGAVSFSRGRGGRGRGSGANTRTFQSRQPPGFTETIDTWGPSPEKIAPANSLQIDNWDDEPSGSTEDWDSEWTGQTTVFGSSTALPQPPSSPPEPPLDKQESILSSSITNNLDLSAGISPSALTGSPNSGTAGNMGPTFNLQASLTDSGTDVLGMSRQSLPSPPRSAQQYPSKVPLSISQPPQSIDIAALLQKAAPRSSQQVGDTSSLGASGSLNSSGQGSILSSISSNVAESMKAGVYVSNGSSTTIPSSEQTYSSPSMNDSMFSSSGLTGNVSLGSSSGVKVLGLSPPNSNLASRTKPQRSRLPHSSSKIPASAVEMPEDAMAALDMQFTGLEFGTETFDFTSEVKQQPIVGSSLVSGSSLNSRDPSAVSNSVPKDLGNLNSSLSQTPQSVTNYSATTSTGVGSNSYPGTNSVGNVSSVSNTSNTSGTNQSNAYGSSFSVQASGGTGQYQNSYVNASSHSSLASISVPKTLSGLKDSSQSYSDSSNSNLSGSLSTNVSAGGTNTGSSGLSSSLSSASNVQPTKSSVPGKPVNSMGASIPPGVQQHGVTSPQQQVMPPHHLTQQHLPLQQQVVAAAQQPQQTPQIMAAAAGPSQYVSPTAAALQGTPLPPQFYNLQQPAMYSYEDLQLFQQRIPHMQQAPPVTLPAGREGALTSPASYSVADASKFRTDQNSSPVPSTINQQGAAPGGGYITAAGNAAIHSIYMYHPNIPAVPSSFAQYGHPAALIFPPNTHTGSTNTQFPGPPKLPYGGTSTYYDNMSQTQDYKAGYASGSQGQSKSGPNSNATASNSGTDLSVYKNHLGKVSRSYDKQGFHTGTPPPFNLAGSGTNPMTANAYGHTMYIPTLPAAAQHHSTLVHHQLHQDGSSSTTQRTGATGVQNKGGSKVPYTGSYWGSN